MLTPALLCRGVSAQRPGGVTHEGKLAVRRFEQDRTHAMPLIAQLCPPSAAYSKAWARWLVSTVRVSLAVRRRPPSTFRAASRADRHAKGGNNVAGRFRGVQARRVLGGGFAVIALSLLVLFVPIIVYAFVLAVRVRGVPDQTAINSFAAMLSPALTPWVERVLTPAVAFWIVRRAAAATPVDGLFVGLVAGLLSVGVTLAFGGVLAVSSAVVVVILAGLGWLGGFVGHRMSARS